MKIFLAQIYCFFFFGFDIKKVLELKYFWCKFIACSFLFIIVKGIIRMKIFLAQIYCLFLFGFDSKKLGKKMFDVVYKHHAVVCV